MIYQTLKYCLARIGLSVFLAMTLGFGALFYLREIAMPQVVIDDTPIQLGLALVCALIGFFAPSAIGEWRMMRAIHKLKDINLESDEKQIIGLFKKLFSQTYSFYFLPAQGEWFRGRLIPLYANYLMAIGKEDLDSVRVYLKAFLRDPQDSKFRNLLIATLGQGYDLADEEIDLLMVALKAGDYKDTALTNHLASVFLKKQDFTLRSELLFLKAVENKSADAEKIVHFVVSFLLKKERSDRQALTFYLLALPYHLPCQEVIRGIIGHAWCDGRWRATDVGLHEQCGEVFSSLDKARQEEIARSVDKKQLSAKLQRVKLFSHEDKQYLKQLKERTLLRPPDIGRIKETLLRSVGSLIHSVRRVIYTLIDVAMVFRFQSAQFKLTIVCVLLVLVSAVPGFKYLKERKLALNKPLPAVEAPTPVVVADSVRIYTVQIAAVFSESQANKIKGSIQKKGVEGLYIVESKRSSGGSWYKIRVGKFDLKEEAQRLADELMENKVIKNYIVLSIARKQG